MTQHHDMLTIGGYMPLTYGQNTMRKASAKYNELRPGDHVTMRYYKSMDDNGEPQGALATEFLIVSAVCVGSFDVIYREHANMNHGTPVLEEPMPKEGFLEFYPDLTDDSAFMAIYFRS